ncbi:hypothetical protein Tco_0015701 [Tanacetum coccineum]
MSSININKNNSNSNQHQEAFNPNNDADKEMFDVDALNDEVVFVARQNENVIEEIVDAAQVSTTATIVTITTKEITLPQALEALKTSKPKVEMDCYFKSQLIDNNKIYTNNFSQQLWTKGKELLIEEL